MLDACGVSSPEELFAHLPDEVRLNRPLNLAPGISEYEIVRLLPRPRGRVRQRLRQLPRRRRVQPLPSRAGGYRGLARRVPHLLHALSGRDRAGHAHHHLRIPDHDLPAHRHGRGQRVHVRRLHRRARSRHDGGARHRQGPRADRQKRASRVPRSARHLRQTSGHARRRVRLRGRIRQPRPGRPGTQDGRPHRRGHHPDAEFLRHRGAGESGGGNRPPSRRAAGRRVHRSRLAGPAGAARRRRYRGRRTAILRHLPELRRTVRRHHRHQGKISSARCPAAWWARPPIRAAIAPSA